MKEVEANKVAWSKLSEEHYHHFKKSLKANVYRLNPVIVEELGDIKGKTLIHLQCNTGADTIALAKLGAIISGVDLVPDNVKFAKRLASDFGIENAQFIGSDLMKLSEIHHQKYDIVFTSEGVLGWLPDLNIWARTIRSLLKDDGFFYINEIHPFFLIWDEEAFEKKEFIVKYPYFGKFLNESDTIGGYAVPSKNAKAYDWMFSISEVINALIDAGLDIKFFHEFDTLCFDAGKMTRINNSQYRHPEFENKIPMHFSIKTTIKR